LCDLLSRPDLWPTLFQYLHGLTQITVWPDVNLGEAAALAQWRSRLIAAVGTFGDGCRVDGLSPLPAMVLLVAGLRSLRDELGTADGPGYDFHRALEAAVATATPTASPLADADVAYWLSESHAGQLDARAARIFAALGEAFERDRTAAHLLPTVRLLLHLANPVFDPARFGRRTLSALAANPVHARPASRPGAATAWGGMGAAVLDRLPIGRPERRRRQALSLLDRVIAGGPWA